jgi:protocatechuate 3,4-dioxygenase beta subunit
MNTHTRINAPPFGYADLVAEAARIFPDDYKPSRKAGLGSVGSYSVAELRSAHIAMNIKPHMRAEQLAAMSALWDAMAAHALHGGPEYDAARDQFAAVEDERQGRAA